MRHYRIIFLLLSSLLLYSCIYHKLSSYEKKSDFKVPSVDFSNSGSAVKYRTSIDVLNKHFTGIVVYKKTDTTTWHLVFVTELGMSMFDFVVKGDSMLPVSVFEGLNKPQTINALVRNFETVFLVKWRNKNLQKLEKSNKVTVYLKDGKHERFFIDNDEPGPEQWVFYKRKKESRTNYSPNYDHIKLKQYGVVKLYIEMDKIKEQ